MFDKSAVIKHEYIGDVWVDSGQVKVGDPCYEGNPTSKGTVTVQSGLGDGAYPVIAQVVEGFVINIFVDFDPTDIFGDNPNEYETDEAEAETTEAS